MTPRLHIPATIALCAIGERAESIARSVDGVYRVDNRLTARVGMA